MGRLFCTTWCHRGQGNSPRGHRRAFSTFYREVASWLAHSMFISSAYRHLLSLRNVAVTYRSHPRGSSFSFTRHMSSFGNCYYSTFRWRRLYPLCDSITKQLMMYRLLQERQMDLVEVLSFLLMMSTMELGKVSHSMSSGGFTPE